MTKSAAVLWVIMAVSDDILPAAHRILLAKMYRLDNGARGCRATAEKLSLYTGLRPRTVDDYRRELAAVGLLQRHKWDWHATIPDAAVPRSERPSDDEIRACAGALEQYITNGRPPANPRQASGKFGDTFPPAGDTSPPTVGKSGDTSPIAASQIPDSCREYEAHQFPTRTRKVVGEVPRRPETPSSVLLRSTPELQLQTPESAPADSGTSARADNDNSGGNDQRPTPATRALPDDSARLAAELKARLEAKRQKLIEEPDVKPDVVDKGMAVGPEDLDEDVVLPDLSELDDDKLPF